jgi:hypothetical protein
LNPAFLAALGFAEPVGIWAARPSVNADFLGRLDSVLDLLLEKHTIAGYSQHVFRR